MNQYYYLNPHNIPQGPHSLDQLAGMMASGRVNPTTLVACKGGASWEPLGSVLSRENIATPEVQVEPGTVGRCPGCGHDLSGSLEGGYLPADCPRCGRSFWTGVPGIKFWANFRLAFRNYFKFSGRATRAEFWCFQFINFLISFALYLLSLAVIITTTVLHYINEGSEKVLDNPLLHAITRGDTLTLISLILSLGVFGVWSLIILIPSLSVTVRRMHDVGWSGKWLIPYFIIIILPAFIAIPCYFLPDGSKDLSEPLSLLSLLVQLGGYALGIFLLVLMVLDSTRGANKYGPSSKYPLG